MRMSLYEVSIRAWLFRQSTDRNPQPDLESMPEEHVRQWCLHELIRAYGISICRLNVEWS